jgi:acyl-CoA synthetase (AMP-forming)/AMP-acid ligase II
VFFYIQVSPAELESLLIQHPAVKDAGVIGIPDERAGELPVAFVVKQPNQNVTEEELVRYISGNVDTITMCNSSRLEIFQKMFVPRSVSLVVFDLLRKFQKVVVAKF